MIGLLIQKVLLVVWRIAAVRIKVIAYMDTATIYEVQSIKQTKWCIPRCHTPVIKFSTQRRLSWFNKSSTQNKLYPKQNTHKVDIMKSFWGLNQ